MLMRAQVGSCSSSIPWAHMGVKEPSHEQHSALHLHTKCLGSCIATLTPCSLSVPQFPTCVMSTEGPRGSAGSRNGLLGGQQSLCGTCMQTCVRAALSIHMHFTYRCSSVPFTSLSCDRGGSSQAVLGALQPSGDPQWDFPAVSPQLGQMPHHRDPKSKK